MLTLSHCSSKKEYSISEVADSFRNNILSKGGTEHPMVLYKRFRGQEPSIDALLIRNGIKKVSIKLLDIKYEEKYISNSRTAYYCFLYFQDVMIRTM